MLSQFLTQKFPNKNFSLTMGGYYSIIQIFKQLKLGSNDIVLLPSYLCSTILIPFKKLGIKFRFYKITENLTVDQKDFLNKIDENTKVIFFINYFGFSLDLPFRNLLKELKRKHKLTIIEDTVQSFFSNIEIIGNYAFNSFRKFFPVEGSVIVSETSIESYNDSSYNKYFFYKFTGQFLRYLKFQFGINSTKLFLKCFANAEINYYQNKSYIFNDFNKFLLSKYNIDQLCLKRKENFNFFLDQLKEISFFRSLPQDVVPFGYPIIIDERDKKRKLLIKHNIFCPVHWHLPEEVSKKMFSESWYLSSKILTIPVSENIGKAEQQFLLKQWEKLK